MGLIRRRKRIFLSFSVRIQSDGCNPRGIRRRDTDASCRPLPAGRKKMPSPCGGATGRTFMYHTDTYQPNPGKELVIEVRGFGRYARYPVKTHVVAVGEDLPGVLTRYVAGKLQKDDYLFLSEKLVAICQGRAFDIDRITPRPLARFLCRFVYHSPYGIGLGSPWTMELALRDAGVPRILLAAFFSALTKPLGIRGVFYRVAGVKARAIDGPCDCTIPPYNHYAKMAPAAPNQAAQALSERLGCPVVIIDANDLSVEVLGRSSRRISPKFCRQVFRDNPLGQSSQSTPMAIVRRLGDLPSGSC